MSLQELYDAAIVVIKEHNSIIGQDNPGYLDQDKFLANIKASGGTTVDRLKGMSYEDILNCMPQVENTAGQIVRPIAVAKDVAKIFRGKETQNANEPKAVSAKKADKMSLRELVEAYDPEDSENAVGKRLKEISKGERFLVFSSGRIVDGDTTLKLLQEVKQGYEGRLSIEVDGEIKEIYSLGDLPDNFVEENPIYKNRPLRPDGTCDQTNRSWNGIDQKVRQLVRVAIDDGALKDLSIEKVHDILDTVMGGDAFNKLSKIYPSAAIAFKKLDSVGKLPTLKLVLNKNKGACKTNRPFDKAKKVSWTVSSSKGAYWEFYNQ